MEQHRKILSPNELNAALREFDGGAAFTKEAEDAFINVIQATLAKIVSDAARNARADERTVLEKKDFADATPNLQNEGNERHHGRLAAVRATKNPPITSLKP